MPAPDGDRGSRDDGRAPAREIEALLARASRGEDGARELLIDCLYSELHEIAAALMQGQRPDHTLQATALVSELCVKLGRGAAGPWNDREHFISYAARAMRSVLTDHARSKKTIKRNRTREGLALDRILIEYEGRALDIATLDEALHKLECSNPRIAKAIEARFYAGATPDEAARMAGLSRRSYDRQWRIARIWLYKELR